MKQILSVFNKESEIQKQASKIVEFARRPLFLTDSEINWQACIWYMDRFQFDKSRINASSPVKSLSFINIYEKKIVGIYNYTQNI